jgi:propanediol dehydratase small subunit
VLAATDYPEDWATRIRVAAALCAVADQVVPDIRAFISPGTAAGIRDDILAIATELEGHC